MKLQPGTYAEVKHTWKNGDVVELVLPMEATLIEANPLVEENRNQVAIKRGPVVYCLKSPDLPGKSIFNTFIPSSTKFYPKRITIDGAELMSLEGTAKIVDPTMWKDVLYRTVNPKNNIQPIKLIHILLGGTRALRNVGSLPLSR